MSLKQDMGKEARTQVAIKLARRSSDYLLAHFRNVRTGALKADGSLVSKVDSAIEKLVLSQIKAAFPYDGVISEESDAIKTQSGWQWIIDPLDGTHNFLAGLPIFGTLLALAYDGEVSFSICAFPALGETFVAKRKKGAFLNGKAIRVSPAKELKGAICLLDGNYRTARKQVLSDVSRFAQAGCRLRLFGSSPFSLTRVAAGQALIAINRAGTPWDIAASSLLVEEAGGNVTEPSGKPWSIHSKEIIATNGIAHNRVLTLL